MARKKRLKQCVFYSKILILTDTELPKTLKFIRAHSLDMHKLEQSHLTLESEQMDLNGGSFSPVLDVLFSVTLLMPWIFRRLLVTNDHLHGISSRRISFKSCALGNIMSVLSECDTLLWYTNQPNVELNSVRK